MPIKIELDTGRVPVKVWTDTLEPLARQQLENVAQLPIIHGHIAAMPDVHAGIGATVGSVIPTKRAVIPAAAGVDLGCGVHAIQLSLMAKDLPESLGRIRSAIEAAVPLGFEMHRGVNETRKTAAHALQPGLRAVLERHPKLGTMQKDIRETWVKQLGTLGGGNHFIEVCLDEEQHVWVMLHSGSRGIGNVIGRYFIERARRAMEKTDIHLPDRDLAWLAEGSQDFEDYVEAVHWAQDYAMENRRQMMLAVLDAIAPHLPTFRIVGEAINCLAGETKVMTRDGSRAISELAGSDHEVLTVEGRWVRCPIKTFGVQRLFEITLSRSGVMKKVRATAGHRWLLHNVQRKPSEATTAELKPGDRLRHSFPPPTKCGLDPEFVARGFVFGDGSVMHGKACANFCGQKDEYLLPYFHGKNAPRTYPGSKRISCLPVDWKRELPQLDLPPEALRGWLAGYFAADGDVGKTGRPTLSSAVRENLEHVRKVCTALGIGTFGIRTRIRSGFGAPPSPLHLMGFMRGDLTADFFIVPSHRERFVAGHSAAERRSWNVVNVRDTGESEEVFCAVVDKTHSFALEDNILTGNCHHNYVARENHFGENLLVTRKGAIRAGKGDMGIIPGSMGARSFIVRGKGNAESLCSCAHGAGRLMSRNEARKRFSRADLAKQTEGVECRKDDALIDEIPSAYKPIQDVMDNQSDLVEVVHTLRQVVCVKG